EPGGDGGLRGRADSLRCWNPRRLLRQHAGPPSGDGPGGGVVASTALIACGAFARELLALTQKHGWDADVLGISVLLHNRPDRIPAAVLARIREARKTYDRVVVVYGDCGTGGQLDALLEREGVQRIAGPHCYEIYAAASFDRLMAEELGTYFLTDFLVRSF